MSTIFNFELCSVSVTDINRATKFQSLFDVKGIKLLCNWQTAASFW